MSGRAPDRAVGGVLPREVVGDDRAIFFARQRDPDAIRMAAFTAALTAFLGLIATRPLYARAASDNVASLRVLAKCGFAVVGHDRGYANARGAAIGEVVLRLGTGAWGDRAER